MKRVIVTALLTLLMAALLIGAFAFSGFYNVGATDPHWQPTFTILEAIRERSVDYHSSGIPVPKLDDPKLLPKGASLFQEQCRYCHGSPTTPPADFAKGLYPEPPNLSSGDIQKEANDAQIFWIVKNGFKMTGMPSFGKSQTDEAILAMVATLRKLPGIDAVGFVKLMEPDH